MSVFNQHYAGQYDQFYAGKDYSGECDLIEAATKRFAKTPPETVIDVGCGTGGHAIELARRGYRVTGVDLSQAMLDQAGQKSAAVDGNIRPTWLQGDVRDFDADSTFDLGIMMFAVIGYLVGNEDVLKGLRNIRRQLKPGALFVCDFWYGPSVLSVKPTDRVRVFNQGTGRVIRSASTAIDVARHSAVVTIQLWSLDGDRLTGESSETHHLRYFFPQEFALMLSVAGFRLHGLTAFPSLDKPLGDDTWNAFAVAEAV
jgi:SAM-dependent methyltransferase